MRLLSLLLAFAGILFTPTASAEDRPCRFFLRSMKDGTEVSVCADNVRQINAAFTAIGSLDPRRSASTFTSPAFAGTNLSSGYPPGYGFGYGEGFGYVPPPDDPRQAWAIRDALLGGVRVTSFEEQLRRADDDGIRDGQHAEVMQGLEAIKAELARARANLLTAIRTGNADLARKFESRIASLEQKLQEKAKVPAKDEPKPGEAKAKDEPAPKMKLVPCTSGPCRDDVGSARK